MESRKKELFKETKDKFVEFFGSDERCAYVLAPASLVFLGDHTHYNEGVLLSAAVDKYIAAAGRKRKDGRVFIVNNFTRRKIEIKDSPEIENDSRFPERFIYNLLLQMKQNNFLTGGAEIAFTSDIPDCFGIGSVAAHQIALLKLIKKISGLRMSKEEMVSFSRKMEMMVIGKISNEAHHWTVLNSRHKSVVYCDLRTKTVKNIHFSFDDFDIVLLDTEVDIPDSPKICSERIEECEVGAKALKQYMWGIKNLRDISDEFLKKKVMMLPRRLYQRINYNVQERMRVEDALRGIFNDEISGFGNAILNSHRNISTDYIISSEQIDFLVEQSAAMKGVIASKMISCSPKRSLFSIVNKEYTDTYISEIKSTYSRKYGTELSSYKLNITSGVKLFKHLEEVFA